MNPTNLARTAYTSTAAPTRTPQGLEIDAFSQITQRLQSTDARRDPGGFVRALHDNRQLWTTLAIDVADAGNQLPRSLRAQIFYLAEFTDHHTSKVLRGIADVAALIDINTSVMRGLRQAQVQK